MTVYCAGSFLDRGIVTEEFKFGFLSETIWFGEIWVRSFVLATFVVPLAVDVPMADFLEALSVFLQSMFSQILLEPLELGRLQMSTTVMLRDNDFELIFRRWLGQYEDGRGCIAFHRRHLCIELGGAYCKRRFLQHIQQVPCSAVFAGSFPVACHPKSTWVPNDIDVWVFF